MTAFADVALSGISSGSPWAAVVSAACGAATSIGPCAAPRAAALSALAGRRPFTGALLTAAAFVLGICACYATAGYLAACAGKTAVVSPVSYYVTAVLLCAWGAYGLFVGESACSNKRRSGGSGAGFAAGALSASIVSPCCTALMLPIAFAASQAGNPARAALLMGCFSLGHSLPMAAAAMCARKGFGMRGASQYRAAVQTVVAAVTIATGMYYGVLA